MLRGTRACPRRFLYEVSYTMDDCQLNIEITLSFALTIGATNSTISMCFGGVKTLHGEDMGNMQANLTLCILLEVFCRNIVHKYEV